MRYLIPLLVLVIAGCAPETAPAPAPAPGANEEAVGVPRQGGEPIPLGELSTPEEFAAKADIPLYPGAETPEKQSNIRRDGPEARYEVVMLTKDSPEKVLAFYKGKLDKWQSGGDRWFGVTPKHHMASIQATPEGGKTKIVAVVRVTEP